MEATQVITIYYYDGNFYLPTNIRSVDGILGMAKPIAVAPADDRAKLAEEIELKAIAGNPTVTRADFRAHSNNVLLAATHLPTWQAFYDHTQRWSITESNGAYTLTPFKPAPFRGVVEDPDHAVGLDAANFVDEAIDGICAQLKR